MDKLIKVFIVFVRENHGKEPLYLESILQYLKCTKSRLYNTCKKELNMPPMEYVNNICLENSLKSLRNGKRYGWLYNGYSDDTTFYKSFKNKFKIQWRVFKIIYENINEDDKIRLIDNFTTGIWNGNGRLKDNLNILADKYLIEI
jgi:AraC-like DNA-binding protein